MHVPVQVDLIENMDQMVGLREAFSELDGNNTGMINTVNLREGFLRQGFDVTEDEVERIIANLDFTGNGRINYTEFMIATIEVKRYLGQDLMMALFKYFDVDHSGVITAKDLREAFGKTGKVLKSREIANLMQMYGTQDEQSIRLPKV